MIFGGVAQAIKSIKKCDPYTNEWIVSLTRKYGCHTTRSRSSSVASATAELTWSESEPALPDPSTISNADDSLQLDQPLEPNGPKFFDSGVCLMDSTFFENFVCNTKTCKQLLDIKDIRSFTVDKLWGCSTSLRQLSLWRSSTKLNRKCTRK